MPLGPRYLPGQLEGAVLTGHLDDGVRAPAAGEALDHLFHVLLLGVDEHVRPTLLQGELAPVVMAVHGDDLGGAEQAGAHHAGIAAGAAAQDHHGVAGVDLRQLRAKVAAGQDAAAGQHVHIVQLLRNDGQAVVGDGDRTYSVWQPSIRQPRYQPPSTQLFTKPRLQKKHSPQKVSTLETTRSPGLIFSPRRPRR